MITTELALAILACHLLSGMRRSGDPQMVALAEHTAGLLLNFYTRILHMKVIYGHLDASAMRYGEFFQISEEIY